MVATHVLPDTDPLHEVASGRASALFALVAGVSLALLAPSRRALLVRAAAIAVIGLLLGQLDSGLAVILTSYGVLFVLVTPFLGLSARWLLAIGAAWVVSGPVASQLVRPHLPPSTYENSFLARLEDPGPLVSELLFTGYYPAVPWLAYLLVGLGVGRLDLARLRTRLGLVAVGAGLVLAVPLLARPPLTDVDRFYGTTPVGPSDGWGWLLVLAPHSGTPLDLAATIGSALLVLGLCLLLARGRVVAVLFGAGTMTLTLYSLHVVLRTPEVWPADHGGWGVYAQHVGVLLAVGAAYAAARRRGPLERLVGALTPR